MNEFLLFAFVVIYLVIHHGTPADHGSDQQASADVKPSNIEGRQ